MLITFLLIASLQLQSVTSNESSPVVFPTFLQNELINKEWKIEPCPVHKGSKEQQEIVCYAWDVSAHDKTFIYLLKAENGEIDSTTKHRLPYRRNGKQYNDYGLCGVSEYYYPEITNDPRFKDWRWQVEQCYRLYKGGTKFYGRNNIPLVKKFFIF